MKRLAYAALVPFLAVSLVCKKEAKAEREGIVNFLTGTVSIIDGGKKSSAAVGDIVKKGMRIETGKKSFMDIYFDGSAVRVLENSSVEISDLGINIQEGTEKSSFFVKKGSVFARVVKKLAKDDSFSIRTPTTTAGVRGTEFMVVSDELKILIACLNGSVQVNNDVTPGQEPVLVKDEQQVVVEGDKPMTVRHLTAGNRKLMNDIKKNFQEMKKSLRE